MAEGNLGSGKNGAFLATPTSGQEANRLLWAEQYA